MENISKGQVNRSAAEIYQEFFVPALFAEWADRVAKSASITKDQRVLDVACGTGVLTRAVTEQVGTEGSVVGLDVNDGMLTVARSQSIPSAQIEYRQGAAESLPFEDNSFDAVVSQFGLMFFEDRAQSINEMIRVLKPDGHFAVAVWGALAETPGYQAMVDLLTRLFGAEVAEGIRAPYVLGDTTDLTPLFANPKIENLHIATHSGQARFESLEAWIFTDIKGWVLADVLDDAQVNLLLDEAQEALKAHVTDAGTVRFSTPAHIITGQKG